jgi:glycerol-3-phosphate dehydrogenase
MATAECDSCDVLVVGGGIHGVGVAQAAAAAGYRVVLLEQRDLAFGTSSRSSKLIHGGLRYLESAEISLVRESLRERELLIKIAPDLVHRQDFYLPVYQETSRRPWMMRVGLSAYTILAGLKSSTWYRSVPESEWGQLDGLRTDGLQHVFCYSDAQTDDAALTRAVMRSAESLGAKLIVPGELTSIEIHSGDCSVEYLHEGQVVNCRAKVVVNAAGPWANHVLSCVTPEQADFPVDNIQGTHLELPGEVTRGCYYAEMPSDGRAFFVIPWKGRTMIGTTEHAFDGDPAEVRALDEEVDYLIEGYLHYFPNRDTTVLDRWAGLRVLPKAQGAAFKRSRETQLPVDDRTSPRLLSIFGGKLTGYRATALKVMDKLAVSLPSAKRKALTSELTLQG